MYRFVTVTVTALALGATPSAWAACSAMSAQDFQDLVDQAMGAIDDDDLVRHGQVFRTMQQQLPCLDAQLPTEAWAEFLVGFAVVEYAMGRDWEHALEVALWIKPDVTRSYGPVEVRNYGPAADFHPEGSRALPEDAEFFVDGKPVTREPALGALHIVQRNKAGVWTTFLLQGEELPPEWKVEVVETVEEGPKAQVRASIFALGGLASSVQSVTSGRTDGLIGDVSGAGPLVGLGSYGDYVPAGPVGLFWDLSSPMQLGGGMGVEAYIGAAAPLGSVMPLAGAGMTSVTITDINGSRSVILPQPHLGARYVTGLSDGLDLDVVGGAGWVPSGWHGKLHAGVKGGQGLGWNAGLEFSGNGGFFEEQTGPRVATSTALRIGLRVGLSLGS